MLAKPIERDIDFTTLTQYTNETVALAFQRTKRILMEHSKPIVSVSGGSDSDVILDMIWRLDTDRKARYIWIDTGLEMQATKDHIADLQAKYGIEIETIKPKVPIPLAVKKYGVPFMSKYVSDMIGRLQNAGFDFKADTPIKQKNGDKWWNSRGGAFFDIKSNEYLKEYMIASPPPFTISDKCCNCAKKEPAHNINKMGDLSILGIRTAEGGVRSTTYKSCFLQSDKGDKHFPAFWFLNSDKKAYNEYFGVVNSAAYTVYGFRRTGCAGCPFNSRFDDELAILRKYEPKLAVAAENIFGESYDYTRKYKEFKLKMKYRNQYSMFESEEK